MAYTATTLWEARAAGSNSNGGAFDAASSGTDFSFQDAAQLAFTDLVIDGTTSTKATSAAHPFGPTHVGNVVNITGGAGFTVQRRQIQSVSGVIATFDASLGTLGSTGGTGNLGGAVVDPGLVTGIALADNTLWLKTAGSPSLYTLSSTTANIAGGRLASTAQRFRIRGYQTIRGDYTGVQPILRASTTGFTLVTLNGSGQALENVDIDGNSSGTTTGVSLSSTQCSAFQVKIRNTTTTGLTAGSQSNSVHDCECTGCSGTNAFTSGGAFLSLCTSHANSVAGFKTTGAAAFALCYSYANTGTSDGFNIGGSSNGAQLLGCVAYGNGGDGFDCGSSNNQTTFVNCLSVGNSVYGYYNNAVSVTRFLNCADWNNTSGSYDLLTNPEIYNRIALSADPFTNAAGGDFSLNNTAGGGALLRALGYPATFRGTSTANYLDVGAAQVQAAAAAAGGRLALMIGGRL